MRYLSKFYENLFIKLISGNSSSIDSSSIENLWQLIAINNLMVFPETNRQRMPPAGELIFIDREKLNVQLSSVSLITNAIL